MVASGYAYLIAYIHIDCQPAATAQRPHFLTGGYTCFLSHSTWSSWCLKSSLNWSLISHGASTLRSMWSSFPPGARGSEHVQHLIFQSTWSRANGVAPIPEHVEQFLSRSAWSNCFLWAQRAVYMEQFCPKVLVAAAVSKHMEQSTWSNCFLWAHRAVHMEQLLFHNMCNTWSSSLLESTKLLSWSALSRTNEASGLSEHMVHLLSGAAGALLEHVEHSAWSTCTWSIWFYRAHGAEPME